MNRSMKIIDFLKSHELISVHALEKKCGIPQSTIGQAFKGRGIPEKYHESLIKELKSYGFKVRSC